MNRDDRPKYQPLQLLTETDLQVGRARVRAAEWADEYDVRTEPPTDPLGPLVWFVVVTGTAIVLLGLIRAVEFAWMVCQFLGSVL